MGVSKTGNPWIVNALGCTLCRVALCLVAALYAVSYGCTPCCSAPRHIKLTTGDRSCRLARRVVVWLLGCHLARVLRFTLSLGHSHYY